MNALSKALQAAQINLDLQDLAEQVSSHVDNYSQDKIYEVLRFLFSLHDLAYSVSVSIEDITQQVTSAIREDIEFIKFLPEQLDRIERNLKMLLRDDEVIANSYKARVVLADHQSLASNFRVFSDLRSIFTSDATIDPLAMGVVHTLKVEYRNAKGANEFFVVLDSIDLAILASEVGRALEKDKTLKTLMGRAGIHCVQDDGL
jgi:hypothetical protein